jgi:hypothetical protein
MSYYYDRSTRNCSAGVAKRLKLNRPLSSKTPFMSLLTYAAYRIGGKEILMQLAQLSEKEKILKIAERWNRLSKSDRRYVSLDDLLFDSGVRDVEFLADVSNSAYFNGYYEIARRLFFIQKEQMGVFRRIMKQAEREEGYKEREKIFRFLSL